MFYTFIKIGFWPIRARTGFYLHYNIHINPQIDQLPVGPMPQLAEHSTGMNFLDAA